MPSLDLSDYISSQNKRTSNKILCIHPHGCLEIFCTTYHASVQTSIAPKHRFPHSCIATDLHKRIRLYLVTDSIMVLEDFVCPLIARKKPCEEHSQKKDYKIELFSVHELAYCFVSLSLF